MSCLERCLRLQKVKPCLLRFAAFVKLIQRPARRSLMHSSVTAMFRRLRSCSWDQCRWKLWWKVVHLAQCAKNCSCGRSLKTWNRFAWLSWKEQKLVGSLRSSALASDWCFVLYLENGIIQTAVCPPSTKIDQIEIGIDKYRHIFTQKMKLSFHQAVPALKITKANQHLFF